MVSSQLTSLELKLAKLSDLVNSIVKLVSSMVKVFKQFVNKNLVLNSALGLRTNKPFFDFEAIVGPSIAVMKKVAKKSGFGGGFKPVLSKKKRKNITLKKSVDSREVLTKSFETGDTTKSENIDMEKECLVEETSFNYSKSGTIANKDHDQMPKEPGVKTKKVLDKSLRKINFSSYNNDDDVLSDVFLKLLPSLKNLVTVSVRKSFALNIGLNKIIGKFSQEKLIVFWETSTPSKFSGIICAFFTFESSLAQATKKARAANILVNTDLKKSTSHLDWAVIVKKIPVRILAEAVCKAVVEFEQSDHANLVTAKWFILIEKDAMHIVRTDLDKKT
ncbi:hypothetical protein G9A89_017944 [Geosiphon pyriformis]|nr:hypothetical protein G9A89_017944 [Geosiphon pyriformis]